MMMMFMMLSCGSGHQDSVVRTDICVLGGSEAAFTAAVQAARMGKQVVLIEPTGHPGGMMVEGILKDIRFGSARVIGGIAREMFIRLEHHYGREADFGDPHWYSKFEPSVAERLIESMIAAEPNITLIRKTRIVECGGVRKQGAKIKGIHLENGTSVEARVFIDASIEGHLLHFAGVSAETIREGNARYRETKNGIQTENTYRQFQVQVDPYLVAGDPSSGLLPTIQEGELGDHGSPSKYIQGFCYRMVLTREEDNRMPVRQPDNYNPSSYEIYRRYLSAGGKLFYPIPDRPNGKTDVGSWHDLSANLYGENWRYPEGDYATQDSIVRYHREFSLGLIWFLQNDPSVDSATRADWAGWGLPKDEFTDNGHWPRRLYIRSARRMVSDYVITEHHTRRSNAEEAEDPVALAWWPPDTHHARRIAHRGYAYNEGFVFGGDDWRPFGISWQALIPRPDECSNLITPTCLSSSYVAYGAIRIVPTFMMLGQSAGCAAALAVEADCDVQAIDYGRLRELLLESGQILEKPDNWLEIITSID